ncbi:hypothetical protein D8674_021216 [Pyrus ussuriensis x Pyrus communis]|uniref:CCHC-type domain-containing protein n=1 Tax=Pyrus ussuriensis x Pyrus communis TaxID=2448454 RepID=A0A5N5GH33_9ROSA|nr:hypothetical protein D8674_021216 [Pyrus ussuriensis x Pyrus communis]
MLFFLTTINLAHVVKKEAPKSLWESLDKKYKINDVGSKKFVIDKFVKYTMLDSKSVVSSVEEIQKLIYELHSEGCEINEHFQVGAIIKKLPTSWNDFKIYLKHEHREMNMEDLIMRLGVEENHRKANRSGGFAAIEAIANYVEKETLRPSRRRIRLPKPSKNLKKSKGACYVCGKSGHKAQDCYHHKDGNHANGNNNNHANMAITDEELVVVVSEVNMVSNMSEWLMDIVATKHIYADRNLFTEYHPAAPGEKLYMGNSTSSTMAS